MQTIKAHSTTTELELNPMSHWPVARIGFSFKVTRAIHQNEYAGSMLRGAFGHALRRLSCMTRQKTCTDCPLNQSCPYTAIFEAPAPSQHSLQKFSGIPHPYIIETAHWGERIYGAGEHFNFSMVLFGQARQHLALIVYAWQQAFARQMGHGSADLHDVFIIEADGTATPLLDKKTQSINHQAPMQTVRFITANKSDVQLEITSPMRLQKNGKPLGTAQISAPTLLHALARRAHLLFEFHSKQVLIGNFSALKQQTEAIKLESKLAWRDWTRYSSRQKQSMALGGVIGHLNLRDVSTELQTLLHLGQWLHAGKNATFGLGGFKLVYNCDASKQKCNEQQKNWSPPPQPIESIDFLDAVDN